MKLSPKELHYLKKELIKLELDREWSYLQKTCPDLITLLSSTSFSSTTTTTTEDLPFIRFIMNQIIQPFPMIQGQTDQQRSTFWTQWQLFLIEWYQRQPCTWMPPTTQEALKRRAMITKLKKMMILLLDKLIQCDIKEASFSSFVFNQRQSCDPNNAIMYDPAIIYGINIISVQLFDIPKRHFIHSSTKKHTYFIIETKNNNNTSYVARRHSDFRQLAKHLQSQFPDRNDIPNVPTKIRNNYNGLPWREMDRRRLRGFLYRLASISTYRHCTLFQEFLSPSVGFTNDTEQGIMVALFNHHHHHYYQQLDLEDVIRRRTLDAALLKDQQEYQLHIDRTLYTLDQELTQLKLQLFQPGGCSLLLDMIKTTEHWHDLPILMKKAFEWGRLCFAFTLHKQLIVSDLALENRNQLKKTHAFLPYRTMATLMKISNPMRMMKTILDLFLAKPFGGRSLMQRAILINLQEEMNSIQTDIDVLEKKLDPMICKKLYNAVITERSDDAMDALEGLSHSDALLFIMKHPDIEPCLTSNQIQTINFSQRETTTICDEDRYHWKEVQRLWYLYGKRQDQTQWMDLLLQHSTGTLLQTVMGILYQPLAQVYQAADLSTTLYELKSFMDDLVKVVNQLEQSSSSSSSSMDSIQPFIDLIGRHQTSFYRFVHKVHTQTESRLFTDLIEYVDTWMGRTYQYDNKPKWKMDAFWKKLDLDHTQEQALRKEIETICEYYCARKLYSAEKRRLRVQTMIKQQQQEVWSENDDDDDNIDDDDDNIDDDDDDHWISNNGQYLDNQPIPPSPPLVSSTSMLAYLLPTFINQVMPLLSYE
ncbi:uncharacterized protein BX664DRAFT_361838 [Halteromyces radiatus]|uniref:uncharacterized protein n=1 Tax=Halteromyces radiatus TaxID=101107 RepID=UPI00222056BA|nr:uncharacterized protein BX664DRAFT_361838 [Halteromyces radiatus]KAI8081717.1 hypothetical protein BX664DRAFT_361838 [Halteromyces radiatus]